MAIALDDLKPINHAENGWVKNPGDFWRNGPSGPPLVSDPDGTLEFDGTPKLVQYTRPSKFGSLIFDHDAVERWDLREVAINGLTVATANDRDLVKRILAHGSAASADKKFKKWKTEGDALVAALRKHAKAQIAAERGTHAHALVEDDSLERSWLARAADGEDLGITVEVQASIVAAWQKCIAEHDLEILANEITVVNDALKAAGSGDVVARNRRDLIFVMPDGSTRTIPAGTIFILDIKSGKWKMIGGYPVYAQAYATQLAIYAGARPYDVDTETRLDWPWPIDQTHAVIAHLDVLGAMEGKPACTLHYIDLAIGRAACDLVVAAMHFADRKDVYSIGELVDGKVVLAEGARMLSGAAKPVVPDVINRIPEGSGVPRFPVLQGDVTTSTDTSTDTAGKISGESSGSESGTVLLVDVNATTAEPDTTVEPSLFDQVDQQVAVVPANAPASAGATVEADDARIARRQALRDRCRNVYNSDAVKGKQIIAEWPTDVPPLNGDHPHSSAELDMIQAVCDRLSPETAPAPAVVASAPVPEPTVESPAVEPAPADEPEPAVAVDQTARRAALRQRCLNIVAKNPAAGKQLIDGWPAKVPGLNSDHPHTADELALIEAVCNLVDPGTDPDPDPGRTPVPADSNDNAPHNGLRVIDGAGETTATPTAPNARLTAVPDLPDPPAIDPGLYVPDEGAPDPTLAEKFTRVETDYSAMSKANQKWMGRLLSEARRTGVSFATREEGMPEGERLYTQRRYELLRGLIKLAGGGGVDDDSVRALVALATDNERVLTTTVPTGAVVGALDAAEAGRLAQLIDALDTGTVLPVIEDGEPMRFIRTA